MSNLSKEFNKKFTDTYLKLEEKGHIPKGAVSDNVNFSEIIDFIRQREKDLLEKVEKIEIDIEMAITTNPDYLQMARDRVHALRRELSSE